MPRGNLSGIAIELLFMRLLKQTEKKRALYGKLLIDVSKALLVLNGFSSDIGITIAFSSPIPHDDLPAIQAAIAKLEIGVSKTELQRELNYDPEEQAKLLQSEEEQALNTRGQLLPPPGLPPGIPGSPVLPGQMYPPPQPTQPAQGNAPVNGGQK